MKYGYRLIRINNKKILKRFNRAVSKLRPDHEPLMINPEKLERGERQVRIASFIAMRGFSEEELRVLEKETYPVSAKVIPAVLILATAAFVFMCFFTVKKWNQFQKIPRVYTFGNKVPLYEAPDTASRIVKRIDLFGASPSDSEKIVTGNAMLLTADSGSMYVVEDIAFGSWIWGKSRKYYVSKDDVTLSKNELQEMEDIFIELKGSSHLSLLSTRDRSAVRDCIRNNQGRFSGATVCNSFSPKELGSFKPLATASAFSEDYIFLCLRSSDGKFVNLRIIIKNGKYAGFEEVAYMLNKFNGPLMWKNDIRSGQQANGIIQFREGSKGPVYQNPSPPYNTQDNEKL